MQWMLSWGLNSNNQEPVGINKKYNVTDDQEPKENFTNTNVINAETDSDMGLNDDAIKKIYFITGTQYDPSELTSRTGGT